MKSKMKIMFGAALGMLVIAAMLVTTIPMQARDAVPATAVTARMTVTAVVADGKRMPEINQEDVVVKQRKEPLQITEWVAARGDRAALDLFILIDDASKASALGSQLDDLRAFISAQPATTAIGVGYMRNATVQIVQNFTTDHAQAAKALRLPLQYSGAFGSPYLSVVDLMKRWPDDSSRREVIMITDGIDRARSGPRFRLAINPDVYTASDVAQRTGTMIHTIYTQGVGRLSRNFWEATNGQLGIAQLSDQTGGEAFYLGLQPAVSFKPYLDKLQNILDNQYLLSFSVEPGQKAGFQYVTVSTELAGVEFGAPDSVWVPAKQ